MTHSFRIIALAVFVGALSTERSAFANPKATSPSQPSSLSQIDRQLLSSAKKGDLKGAKASLDKGANVNAIGPNGFRAIDYALGVASLTPEFDYDWSEYNTQLTSLLAKHGADLNLIDIDGDPRLVFTARYSYRCGDRAKQLIDLGANVNLASKRGVTPLMAATLDNNVPLLQQLINKGANINATDNHGNNALHLAIQNLSDTFPGLEAIQFLAEHGISINAKNKAGKTPIFLTLNTQLMENEKVRNYLASKGAYLELSDSQLSMALKMAIKTWDVSLLKMLLPLHPNFKEVDEEGKTPLMWAVGDKPDEDDEKANQTAIVRLLLQQGIALDDKSKRGETAFMKLNRDTFSAPVMRLLVNAGASIAVRPSDGDSPLLTAVEVEDLALVQLLVRRGASLKEKVRSNYRFSYTPFLVAVDNGNLPIAKYLLEHGANIDDKDKKGIGALSIASARSNEFDQITGIPHPSAKHISMTRYLLARGAKVNARDTRQFTPLMFANSRETVQMFLERKANVNAINDEGYSALLYRTKENNLAVVQLLVQRHASVNISGKDGVSSLMFAVENGNLELVKLLLAHGADAKKGARTGLTPLKMVREMMQPFKQIPLQQFKRVLGYFSRYQDHQRIERLLLSHGAR